MRRFVFTLTLICASVCADGATESDGCVPALGSSCVDGDTCAFLQVQKRVDADQTSIQEEVAIGTLQEELADEGQLKEAYEVNLRDICTRDFFLTLETCVQPLSDGTVHVITGDIHSEWIRDSSAQLYPYVKFAKDQGVHSKLRPILEGALRRQAKYIAIDPYANAFNKDWDAYGDKRLNRGGLVATGNFEIDSSAYFFRLLTSFTDAFPDSRVIHEPQVLEAVKKAISVYRLERDHFKNSKYIYPREPPWELPGSDGRGRPVNYTGMIWGAFRPSDDAQEYGYSVPSNIFVAAQLEPIEKFARTIWKDSALANDVADLRATVLDGVKQFGTTKRDGEDVYCYEVDGLGGCNFMDDANVPSLLSLPYIDPSGKTFDQAIYRRTRKRILSKANPYYFEGKAGKGIGSPHTGPRMIWPMSLIMQAFTAESRDERDQVMKTLDQLNLRGHGMTESFDAQDVKDITRPWFGWPNALFAEYMISQGMCNPSVPDIAHFPKTQLAPKGPWSNMSGSTPVTSFYTVPTEKLHLPQIEPTEPIFLEGAEKRKKKDSEQHIPSFRADGQLQWISKANSTQQPPSVSIEVPQTFSKFMEGLMWRKDMSDDQAMLFQWNQDGPRAFWMENTYIGLDIVYVNKANQIVSIKEAHPLSRANVQSDESASYAIEVPLGWCKRHGVSEGDTVKFQIRSSQYFVAQDAEHFGATPEEVQKAKEDGNYE